MAAITQTNLTTGSNGADQSSYNTASISPTANELVLVAVASANGSGLNTPTITGASMTWTQVATIAILSDVYRLTVFRGLSASPGSGALTIDFAGNSQVRCGWVVDQFDNIDTSGVNGAGAIVQSVSNTVFTGNSLTVTLSAFGDVNNATYGSIYLLGDTGLTNITPGSGFSENGEAELEASTLQFIEAEFKSTNDTSVDWTWNGGSSIAGAEGIAIEIKNATQVTTTSTSTSTSTSTTTSTSTSTSTSSSTSTTATSSSTSSSTSTTATSSSTSSTTSTTTSTSSSTSTSTSTTSTTSSSTSTSSTSTSTTSTSTSTSTTSTTSSSTSTTTTGLPFLIPILEIRSFKPFIKMTR